MATMADVATTTSETQMHHVRVPGFLEGVEVLLADHLRQRRQASWVGGRVFSEAVIKLAQLAVLLQIITEMAGLAVVCAARVSVERPRRRTTKVIKGRDMSRANRSLQACQPPIRLAHDLAVLLATLLMQRRESFVEPRRAVRKVGFDERMHDFVDQRTPARADVHHQRLVARISNWTYGYETRRSLGGDLYRRPQVLLTREINLPHHYPSKTTGVAS